MAPFLVTACYVGYKPYASEEHDSRSHATRAAMVLLREVEDLHRLGELAWAVEVRVEWRGQLAARTVTEARLVRREMPEPTHEALRGRRAA